jgi:hypothetical protein
MIVSRKDIKISDFRLDFIVFKHLENLLMMAFRLFSPKSNNVISAKILSKTSVRRLALATSTTPTYTRPLPAAGLFATGQLRHDWTREEIKSIYDSPIMELLYFGVS